jgi:hypothetical protein
MGMLLIRVMPPVIVTVALDISVQVRVRLSPQFLLGCFSGAFAQPKKSMDAEVVAEHAQEVQLAADAEVAAEPAQEAQLAAHAEAQLASEAQTVQTVDAEVVAEHASEAQLATQPPTDGAIDVGAISRILEEPEQPDDWPEQPDDAIDTPRQRESRRLLLLAVCRTCFRTV